MGFQRARSAEQRQERREAIMAAAAGMLAEMPVAALTLSELSRRVGLAKSNVLRYFESREDVLLEVLMRSAAECITELDAAWTEQGSADAPLAERIEAFAAVYARVLAARPEVLDLLSAQAAVLERNVSTEAVVRFKRAAIAGIDAMAAVLTRAVPELGEAAPSACATILTLSGALYTQAEQSGACESAYLVAPELAALRTELVPALHGAVATIVAGTLARG
ncbi:TetR family transcriptional regulator [Tsukamurella pulmonis]|uniref:Regulatory protein, tetR family n=1 Tax=Tsukamurella pulmonis TaxID=47312 RepID=A0A1H1HA26_9ACTN|nr:TetR family transcriptional regulator [Tsukamurella pulmonis]RDH12262.1 TetR/AcrR family transcriptional regulator [Tsukamurella pulmonis]SDR22355.1 regulatory protein, tetR family [Tsukamurella pulmonis]